ncbi:MAG: hypothetical protein FJ297_16630 [Planctomycetes bacterium]|nr:hypothetical protein [Planctomycetota bacterium]
MARKPAQRIGPYPVVLSGLFVLSCLAIHTWRIERAAPRGAEAYPYHGADERLGARADEMFRVPPQSRANADVPADRASRARSENAASPSLGSDRDTVVLDVDRDAGDITEGWAPEPRPIDVSLLDALAPPGIRSRIAPPVADRVVIGADLLEPLDMPPPPDVFDDGDRIASRDRRRAPWFEPGEIPPALPRQEPSIGYRDRPTWPRAATLVAQFESLMVDIDHGPVRAWSRRVIDLLAKLESTAVIGSSESAGVLEQLAGAVSERPADGAELPAPDASRVSRARYALERRLAVWRGVQKAVSEEPEFRVSIASGGVAASLEGVDRRLRPMDAARGWREYLLVDVLRLVVEPGSGDDAARRELARRLLQRMVNPNLTAEQRAFLDGTEFVRLGDHLRRWAYEPIDYGELLGQLEMLEDGNVPSEPELNALWRVLRWSPWSQTTELAQSIDTHYRNANIRIAVSGEFINRMLPSVQTIEEDVDDQILGTPVTGRSTTMAKLFVELIPDGMRWRMGLVARGNIDSETRSDKGPVTLFTTGATRYHARKLLTIDRGGVLFHRAEAEAANNAELTNVATDFDGMPLLGAWLRSLARRGHADRVGDANAEVESKIGYRVAQRLDEEVASRIQNAEERYRERLLKPLRGLGLNAVPTDMRTTETRLIARYRLATDRQLGSHTPRPMAPGDSMLSVQIHESAINNIVGQLALDGRQITFVDLYKELGSAFGLEANPPDDVPDSIQFAFAERDAVRIAFREGRAELTMRFRAMRAGDNLWEDFEVFTRFSPIASGRTAYLVRDDTIELRGRLGFRDRLPMRAVFTAMLARERKLPLLDPQLMNDDRLEGVRVSQCEIVDGWIGVALSPPEKVAARRPPARASLSDRFRRRF